MRRLGGGLLLCSLAACGSERLVRVEIEGATPELRALAVRAELDGADALEGTQRVQGDLGAFSLLVGDRRGRLLIDVVGEGADPDAPIAAGEGTVQLGDEREPRLRIPLSALPQDRIVFDAAGLAAPSCVPANFCLETALPTGDGLWGIWGAGAGDLWIAPRMNGRRVVRYQGGAFTSSVPAPDRTLHKIWGSGPRDVWATGIGGAIYHHDGVSWAPSYQTTGAFLQDIAGSGPRDVWAVGGQELGGVILHYDGQRWTPSQAGAIEPLAAVWAASPTDAWAAGRSGAVLRFDGVRWSELPRRGDVYYYNGTWGVSGRDFWVVGGEIAIHYVDGAPVPAAIGGTGELLSVFGSGPGDVWLGGEGRLHRFDGQGFETLLSDATSPATFGGIWSGGPGDAWLTTFSGALYRSDGRSLRPVNGIGDTVIVNAGGTAPDDVWFATSSGDLVRRRAGRYVRYPRVSEYPLNAVYAQRPDRIWAAGDRGVLLRYDGLRWRRQAIDTSDDLGPLTGSGEAVFTAARGRAYRFDGRGWQVEALPTQEPVSDLFALGPDDVWAVSRTTILRRRAGVWSTSLADSAQRFFAIWSSGEGDAWAAGTTLLHFDGTRWSEATGLPDNLQGVLDLWGSGPRDIWALSNLGASLMHWDGRSWRRDDSYLGAPATFIWGTGGHYFIGGAGGLVRHLAP